MSEQVVKHKYVETQWSTQGWFGHTVCACCGFMMIGANRALHVRHPAGRASATICDGCVNAIAERADGNVVYSSGEVRQ